MRQKTATQPCIKNAEDPPESHCGCSDDYYNCLYYKKAELLTNYRAVVCTTDVGRNNLEPFNPQPVCYDAADCTLVTEGDFCREVVIDGHHCVFQMCFINPSPPNALYTNTIYYTEGNGNFSTCHGDVDCVPFTSWDQ